MALFYPLSFLSFPSELEITVWCSPKMDMEHLVTETPPFFKIMNFTIFKNGLIFL